MICCRTPLLPTQAIIATFRAHFAETVTIGVLSPASKSSAASAAEIRAAAGLINTGGRLPPDVLGYCGTVSESVEQPAPV